MIYAYQEKKIVVTAYGHDRVIDKISISLFNCDYDDRQNVENYCATINNLQLKDDNWIYAKLISQNTPYFLYGFIPLQFNDIIEKLDDRALEKVIREIDVKLLAEALKGANANIQTRIFSRMTKRASLMLKEDMENLGLIGHKTTETAKNEILSLIRQLIECGEILSPYKDYEGETNE